MNQHHQDEERQFRWGSPFGIALLGFFIVAAFFLLTEHRAHVMGALPYLLLALCPLLHIFGHHGHGAHGRSGKPDQRDHN